MTDRVTYTTEAMARKLGMRREHFNRKFTAGRRIFVTDDDIWRIEREPDPDNRRAYR